MSIFGDDGVDDLLNGNLHNDEDQLPGDADDNDQIFGDNEQAEGETQEGAAAVSAKVQPKKRNVLNPRPRLNVEVLRGQRGLHTIEDYFKDIKYKGKGNEKEDLDEVMRRMQHWGHRMYPTYKFDDVLANIERLGKKKPLQVHMSRYRLGMLESMKNYGEINDGEGDDDDQPPAAADEPYDEFDALLDEQIAISKIDPRTPGPSTSRYSGGGMGTSTNISVSSSSFATPSFSKGNAVISTPYTGQGNLNDTSDLATPLPPSQPTTPAAKQQLSAEQMARIAENRRLAQERLAAKKRAQLEAQKAPEIVQS
ncbi:protein TIPIN homolog [Calliphora vicina]|uniref:protein TIPIN homolog n=1 Tax=Calliphora vicina TaxID=7373 RepID=UPI00325A82CA